MELVLFKVKMRLLHKTVDVLMDNLKLSAKEVEEVRLEEDAVIIIKEFQDIQDIMDTNKCLVVILMLDMVQIII